MIHFILWYFLISFVGLLIFPLAYRLLPALTDRGYAFSRALGWLLWGYIFWLLGSLGVLQNNSGGEIVALLILVCFVVWLNLKTGWREIRDWLASQRAMVLTVEMLFLVTFACWSLVRATNPEIVGTEKPMELGFINAILRSPTLPPLDPWLSGYSISYYHFGYILVAMLARLAGTPGGVAFNLGGSLVFGLSAIGAYGLLYNLLQARSNQKSLPAHRSPLTALLAPFFILIVSNLGGLLHILRLNGVFWRTDETGQMVSPIWSWLDMGRFSQPPPGEPYPHWWWWQSSRVVQDFDFNWVNKGDVIDEFPFFSYLLADLHPHVLAMPFAFLLIGLALHLFLRGGEEKLPWPNLKIKPEFFALTTIVLGGIAFLNTWDAPFYVALLAGVYVITNRRTSWRLLQDFFVFGFTLGISAIVLYLPFYLSFSSQAGGLLPNMIYVTRGIYFWVMFAPFLLPLLVYVWNHWRGQRNLQGLKQGLKWTLILVLALWLLSLLITGFISIVHIFSRINPQAAQAAGTFLGSLAAPDFQSLLRESFIRRLTIPGTLLTLLAIMTPAIASLWPDHDQDTEESQDSHKMVDPFVLLLILVGGLLTLSPEFVYLRDMFGYRINTIFKFYFLAWLMWGIAAAYAAIVLRDRLKSPGNIIFQVALLLVIGLGLLYPAMGLWTKSNRFQPAQWTLDGTAYLQNVSPDEAAAMAWLLDAPTGVVAEAVGGSFTTFARMSAHTGQPTVLGWEFHEIQWRGGAEELGSRKADIERLYCNPSWPEAQQVIQQYDIRYIVVSNKERIEYVSGSNNCPAGLNENKFMLNLPVAFQLGEAVIYEVPLQEQ